MPNIAMSCTTAAIASQDNVIIQMISEATTSQMMQSPVHNIGLHGKGILLACSQPLNDRYCMPIQNLACITP